MTKEKLERMLATTMKLLELYIEALPKATPGKAKMLKLTAKLTKEAE